MIRYRLNCAAKHEFESWFRSSENYDMQLRDGLIACPVCGSTAIEKLPMAPAVISGGSEKRTTSKSSETVKDEIVNHLRAFRQRVVDTSEDVGTRFAEEARKIHFGDAKERNIYGASTSEEARGLAEDGIPFGILPSLPEDQN